MSALLAAETQRQQAVKAGAKPCKGEKAKGEEEVEEAQ